jgi:hypothetical protein
MLPRKRQIQPVALKKTGKMPFGSITSLIILMKIDIKQQKLRKNRNFKA